MCGGGKIMYKKLIEVIDILVSQRNLVSLLNEEKDVFKRLKEIEGIRDKLIKEDIKNGNKHDLLDVWKESSP